MLLLTSNLGGKATNGQSQKSSSSHRNSSASRSANKRNSLQSKGSLMGAPSTSMGVLNAVSLKYFYEIFSLSLTIITE